MNHRPLLTLILLLKVLPTKETKGALCERQAGERRYKLIKPPQTANRLKEENARIRISTYPNSLHVSVTRRNRWTHHCSAGAFNHDCVEQTKEYPITIKEAREWTQNRRCYIGAICEPNGDCWGSSSEKCFEGVSKSNYVEKREHTWLGQKYTLKWRYTCISSWQCLITSFHLPLFLMPSNEGKTTIYTFNQDSEVLTVPNDHSTPILKDRGGERIYLLDKGINPTIEEVNTICIVSKQQEITCLIPGVHESSYQSVIVNPITRKAYMRNKEVEVLQIIGPQEVGQQAAVDGKNYPSSYQIPTQFVDLGKAASIEDLKEIIAAMIYKQMETEMNLVIAAQERVKMDTRTLTIIKSLSKLDGHLIPNILGIKATTKWFNEDLFEWYPCPNVTYDHTTNCDKGTTYNGKERVEMDSQTTCVTVSEDSVNKVDLFNITEENFFNLEIASVSSSAADWDDWRSIRHFGTDIQKVVSTDTKSGRGARSDSSLIPTIPSWFSGPMILSLISFILSIVAIIVVSRK